MRSCANRPLEPSSRPQHCVWKGTVVAIATRHADATDIRFAVNGKPLWIAMPNLAWVEQKRRNGKVITDYLAAQAAGRYLKQAIESGAQEFIMKPFDAEILLGKFAQVGLL